MAEPEELHQLLDANAHHIADALPWRGRSAVEFALVLDPTFEHCGHTLEPLGRELVALLSEELQVSELACWELLLVEVSQCHGKVHYNLSELKERMACMYCSERRLGYGSMGESSRL